MARRERLFPFGVRARRAMSSWRTRGYLHVEGLEVRRLLHAGYDDGDSDPVVQPIFQEPVPGDIVPALGTEPLHSLSSIPALNSLLGAAASVYLDFDGNYEPSWGSYGSVTTPVYDRDGDPSSFSDSELSAIEQIWEQVSEDFSPFDLNVTTVEPSSFANGVAVRVSIGGDGAWTGGSYGGIAYVNSFTNSVVNTVFVFPDHLSNGNPKFVAEASSHETGHSFGLNHQSQYNSSGQKLAEYYTGPGNGTAPIMGNSYSATRGLWWYGTSSEGPGVMQDDLATISRAQNGFGYRPDDYGNTAATAAPIPSLDGHLQASGVITTISDLDYFAFDTDAGQVTLTLTLPAQNNLDARLELRNADGTLITSDAPTDSFGAMIVADLQAGSYRVVVASQGNYGDIGQYTLTADVLAPSIEGNVYFDANRDGNFGLDENGLAGWTVFDDVNGNGVWDATPTSTIIASDTPRAIPTLGAVRSTIVTSGLGGTILDVNVRLTLQHSNISNLVLALTKPDGTTTTLMAVNPTGGTSMLDTRFDDEAATSISDAAAPYSGTFRPLGSLAGIIGKNPNGTWKLLVSDIVGGSGGTLDDFELEITTSMPEPSTTTDAQGRYLFAFSSSGTHHIRLVNQPGYVQTAPPSGGYDLTVDSGVSVAGLDFGVALPAVVGRALFYNHSKFDGNDSAISAADDLAIAADKQAYLPGSGPATFGNISSYTRGINGLIVDVAGLAGPITADDFLFRTGSDNVPGTWQTAPAPAAVSVRPGAGINGADRVEITWADSQIENTWLEVTVKGDDLTGGFDSNTGLPASDVFYFGNRVGDTGSGTPTLAVTNASDEIEARTNIGFDVAITNAFDFNRDGLVNAGDQIAARLNGGVLTKIDLPAAASIPAGDGGNAVASALAVTGDDSKTQSSPDLVGAIPHDNRRLGHQDTVAHLMATDSVKQSNSLVSHESLTELAIDDELLADLLG